MPRKKKPTPKKKTTRNLSVPKGKKPIRNRKVVKGGDGLIKALRDFDDVWHSPGVRGF